MDKFLHFFHSVFHTPFHTMIGVSFLAFVGASFMLAFSLLTVDYFNSLDFYLLNEAQASAVSWMR